MYRNGKKILNAVNHINITWFTWRYIYDIKGIYIYIIIMIIVIMIIIIIVIIIIFTNFFDDGLDKS